MADIEISFINGRRSKYNHGEVNVTVLTLRSRATRPLATFDAC